MQEMLKSDSAIQKMKINQTSSNLSALRLIIEVLKKNIVWPYIQKHL